MTSFGGAYKIESQESKALRSINTESYDYRDQAKLLTKLTSDVSYLAQYTRQMQKGIDAANENIIQQIGDFITEILVVIGGNGDTGFDFGDLKYILQAIGSLFGFDEATGIGKIFPINLFSAAWHFFSTYIIPLDNLGEFIDWVIDSFLATILDIFGEIPIVGQAVQQIVVWITEFRDMVHAFVDMFAAWTQPIIDFLSDTVLALWDAFAELTEPLATWLVQQLGWLFDLFTGWTTGTVTWLTENLGWLADLFAGWTEPIVTGITNGIQFVTDLFGSWTKPFADVVKNNMQWLVNAFTGWTSSIATWVRNNVQAFVDIFSGWTTSTANFVTTVTTTLWNNFFDWSRNTATWITSNVSAFFNMFYDWGRSTATWLVGIGQGFNWLFGGWTEGFTTWLRSTMEWLNGTGFVQWLQSTPWNAFD